jgi:hypothetical protein
MEMTKKQAEFWAFIIIMCTMAAIAILLVDFGIKSAILEESTRLRLTIEEHSGRQRQETNASGASDDAPNDPPFPSDVLVVNPERLEKGNVHNGSAEAAHRPANRRTKPSGQADTGTVPNGNE